MSNPKVFLRLERFSRWNAGAGEFDEKWDEDVLVEGDDYESAYVRVHHLLSARGPFREVTITACDEDGDDLMFYTDDNRDFEELLEEEPFELSDEYYEELEKQVVERAKKKALCTTTALTPVPIQPAEPVGDGEDKFLQNVLDFIGKSKVKDSPVTSPATQHE